MSMSNCDDVSPKDPDPGGSKDPADSDSCGDCKVLRDELDRLQSKHELNYTTLKEKIISTDLLIKRYTAKCQDYDQQAKRLEETTAQLEKIRIDFETLQKKLKSALQELEPLKTANEKLQRKHVQNESKLEELNNKLQSQEMLQNQFVEAKISAEAEAQAAKEKSQKLETNIKKLEAEKKKLKDDLDRRMKGLNELKKQNSSIIMQNKKLEVKVNQCEDMLREHGSMKGKIVMNSLTKRRSHFVSDVCLSDDKKILDEQDPHCNEEEFLQGSILDQLFREVDEEDQCQDDSGVMVDLFLRPLEPAVSPLPASPQSVEIESDNESMDEMAEMLETNILYSSSPKLPAMSVSRPDLPPPTRPAPRRRGRPSKHKLSDHVTPDHWKSQKEVTETDDKKPDVLDVVKKEEPLALTLGMEGPLPKGESLSDPESDGEKTDVPFMKLKRQAIDVPQGSLANDFEISSSDTSDSESEQDRNKKVKVKKSKNKQSKSSEILVSPRRSPRHRHNSEPYSPGGKVASNVFKEENLAGKEGPVARFRDKDSIQNIDNSLDVPGNPSRIHRVTCRQSPAEISTGDGFKAPLAKATSPCGKRKAKSLSCGEGQVADGIERQDSVEFVRRITRSVSCPEGKGAESGLDKDSTTSNDPPNPRLVVQTEKVDMDIRPQVNPSTNLISVECAKQDETVKSPITSRERKRTRSGSGSGTNEELNTSSRTLRSRSRSHGSSNSDTEIIMSPPLSTSKTNCRPENIEPKVHNKSMYGNFVSAGLMHLNSSVVEKGPNIDIKVKCSSDKEVECKEKRRSNKDLQNIDLKNVLEDKNKPDSEDVSDESKARFVPPDENHRVDIVKEGNLQFADCTVEPKQQIKEIDLPVHKLADAEAPDRIHEISQCDTGCELPSVNDKSDLPVTVNEPLNKPSEVVNKSQSEGTVVRHHLVVKVQSEGFLPGLEDLETMSHLDENCVEKSATECVNKPGNSTLLKINNAVQSDHKLNAVEINPMDSVSIHDKKDILSCKSHMKDSPDISTLPNSLCVDEQSLETPTEAATNVLVEGEICSQDFKQHCLEHLPKDNGVLVTPFAGGMKGKKSKPGQEDGSVNSSIRKLVLEGKQSLDTIEEVRDAEINVNACPEVFPSLVVSVPSSDQVKTEPDQRPEDHEDSGIGGTSDEEVEKGMGRKKGIIRQLAVQVEHKNMLQKQFKLSIDSQSSDILPPQSEELVVDNDGHHSTETKIQCVMDESRGLNLLTSMQEQPRDFIESEKKEDTIESRVDKQESIGFEVHSSIEERDSFSEAENSPVRSHARLLSCVGLGRTQTEHATSQDTEKIDAVKRSLGFRPVASPEPPGSLGLDPQGSDAVQMDSPGESDVWGNNTASTSGNHSDSPVISETGSMVSDNCSNTTASFETGSVVSSLASSPVEKVDRMTPLSPLSSSDQEDPLSPLSLSDLEFGAPISPLPPSPFQPARPSSRSSLRSRSPAEKPVRRSPLFVSDLSGSASTSSSHSQTPSPLVSNSVTNTHSSSSAEHSQSSQCKREAVVASRHDVTSNEYSRTLSPVCQNQQAAEEIYEDVVTKKTRQARVTERKSGQAVTRTLTMIGKVLPTKNKSTAKNKMVLNRKQTLKNVTARLSGQQPGLRKAGGKKSSTAKKEQSGNKYSTDLQGAPSNATTSLKPPKKRLSTEETKEVHGEMAKKQAVQEISEKESSICDPVASAKVTQIKNVDHELQPLLNRHVHFGDLSHRLLQHIPPGCHQLIIERLLKLMLATEVDMLPVLFSSGSHSSGLWNPVLADHEIKIVHLLHKLESQMTGMCNGFLNSASAAILEKQSDLVRAKASICRVHASICRQSGNVAQLRVLLYDIVHQQIPGFQIFVPVVVGVWPEVLARRPSGEISPVIEALEFVMMRSLNQTNCFINNKMILLLKTVCRWSLSGDRTTLARQWLSKLQMVTSMKSMCYGEQIYELQMALQLLASCESWEWNNNTLIVDLLWPMLKDWGTNRQNAGISDQLAEILIELLGYVGYMCPTKLGSSLDEVFKTLQMLIRGIPGNIIPFGVQCSAVASMLRLATFNPDLVAVTCQQWAKHHTVSEVPVSLQSHLQDFVNTFKLKVPYVGNMIYRE